MRIIAETIWMKYNDLNGIFEINHIFSMSDAAFSVLVYDQIFTNSNSS